jgi:hypothetical protein
MTALVNRKLVHWNSAHLGHVAAVRNGHKNAAIEEQIAYDTLGLVS